MSLLRSGSPPRLWGIPCVPGLWPGRRRFTPTPVGNTHTPVMFGVVPAVHPHACGEYRRARCHHLHLQRFTPTPVGNTSPTWTAARCATVHPHACGEYDKLQSLCELAFGSPPRLWGIRTRRLRVGPAAGSPPRLWGILTASVLFPRQARFTPTPVGNTGIADGPVVQRVGSPPRLWGIRHHAQRRAGPRRFTPTPVGNTLSCHVPPRLEAVHPHACGEYIGVEECAELATGSPPRLWGIRHGWGWRAIARQVHPHACGEYGKLLRTCRLETTVHPHACGEYLGVLERVPVRLRFTPTPVGNTTWGRC